MASLVGGQQIFRELESSDVQSSKVENVKVLDMCSASMTPVASVTVLVEGRYRQ